VLVSKRNQTMLEILKQLVEDISPKQLGNALKRIDDIRAWLITSTINESVSMSLSERAYLVLNGSNSNKCKNNNIKKFISITQGYRFCGMAAKCECARESVSSKVSAKKQLVTDVEQLLINAKRDQTNIEKYGVTNAGQTELAKQHHRELYEDKDKVKQLKESIKSTNLERYGVENPMQLDYIKEKAINTIRERYGVDNINQLPERKKLLSELVKYRNQKMKNDDFWFKRLTTKFKDMCNVEFMTLPVDYKGTTGSTWYKFKCLACNNEFETWISAGHLPICKKCFPTIHVYKSGEENEIFNYIKSLGINIEQRNRSLIYPLEIDMIIHDKKLAIEYCGLYWHSECSNNKKKDYHINKMKLCEEKGYRLITIFSDEWNNKKDIVKSKLRNIVGMESDHIAARKCNIISVTTEIAKDFYNRNHLQGHTNTQINIGLTYNNSLVACMSFGSARAFTHNKKQISHYELIRYASSINVQGGASKLLKAFERQYNPITVFSYADARWSQGNMYLQLGFGQINKKLNPGYWYTQDYTTRRHRFNFTKSHLVKNGNDPTLTEWQIMQSNKWDRIWDCGQYKFVKTY
jgi:hypothetical protein